MRLEWGPMIAQRRWDLMEWLARKEPSQQLCDTVAELAKGLNEREDKRALKRILYFLKQAGITPTLCGEPAQSHCQSQSPSQCTRNVAFAIMGQADCHGFTPFAAGVRHGSHLHVIVTRTHHRWLYIDGKCVLWGLKDDHLARRELDQIYAGFTWTEVDATFALSRMSYILRNQVHGKPPKLNAVWRRTFENFPVEGQHPTVRLPAARLNVDAIPRYMAAHPEISSWLAGFGVDDEFWPEVHPICWAHPSDLQKRAAKVFEYFWNNRDVLFDQAMVSDHALRLRDLAYRESLAGDPRHTSTLALALNLEAKGADSLYTRQILQWTAEHLEMEVADDEYDEILIKPDVPYEVAA